MQHNAGGPPLKTTNPSSGKKKKSRSVGQHFFFFKLKIILIKVVHQPVRPNPPVRIECPYGLIVGLLVLKFQVFGLSLVYTSINPYKLTRLVRLYC